MCAVALIQLIFPLIISASFRSYEEGIPVLRFVPQEFIRNINKQFHHLPPLIAATSLLVYSVYSVYVSTTPLRQVPIAEAEMNAMAWINRNLPEDSSFLVITNSSDFQNDPIYAWFPVLAGRNNILNIRASIWKGNFAQQTSHYRELVACKDQKLECLFALEEDIAADLGIVVEEPEQLSLSDLVRIRASGAALPIEPRVQVIDFIYISVQERGALSAYLALNSQTEENYRSIRSEGGVLILQPVEAEPLDTSQFID
jgi:hypothetical protein